MALTIAQVSTPNAEMHEGQLMGLRARIIDVTFDSQYLTTGEVLTAASLGWTYLFGAVTLADPSNAAGTASVGCVVKKNTAGSALTFQAQETAGTVDLAFKEVTSNQDLSTFTGRFIVLGY